MSEICTFTSAQSSMNITSCWKGNGATVIYTLICAQLIHSQGTTGYTNSEIKWKVEKQREHSPWDEQQLQQFAQHIWLLNLKVHTGHVRGENRNKWRELWLILTQITIEVFRFYTWIWPLPSSADSFWAPNPNTQAEKTKKRRTERTKGNRAETSPAALPAPGWASTL